MRYLSIALATGLVCGSAALAQEAPAEKITYVDHVLPLFKMRCGSCHNANDKKGGLTLDNYAGVMEGGASGVAVEGGDPGASYLWSLVTHESEPKMPPNADKLPEAELALIRKWIEGGVLETSGSTAKVKKMSSVGKIEVSTERPAEIALPQVYLGDPQVVSPRPNAVTALATSPWASLAAVSGYKQVALFNSETLDPLGVLPFPEGQPQIIKFSRNGSLLLVGGGRGGASGRVIVFDVKTGERVIEIGDEYDSVLAADISPDHTMIALGGPKRMLRMYSVATGELMYENKKHTDWLTAIEFSPDGVLLASGDRANGLVVWESFTGRPFHDLVGHQGAINDVSWRPDSNALASGSADGTIKLWEMNNGTQIKSWNAHGQVEALDYIRDGRLVSTGRDRIVRLWNGDGGQIREFPGMTDLGMEVAFDAEKERALGGDWTGVVRVWNAADGALLGQFDTNPPTVAMRLASTQQALAAAQQQAKATGDQLAALQKAMADKVAAADAAVKLAATGEEKQKVAMTAKAEADKVLAEKTAALKAAEQALAAAKAAFEKATQEQAVAAKTATDAAAVVTTATTAEKAAQDETARLKAAAEKAVAEAKPTDEQTKALQAAAAAAKAAADQAAALNAQIQKLQAIQPPAPVQAASAAP